MSNPCITSGEPIEDVGDDFGGWHLLVLFQHVHEVHEAEAALIVAKVQLLLSLQKSIYHHNIYLVILTCPIFSPLNTSYQVLLIAIIIFE